MQAGYGGRVLRGDPTTRRTRAVPPPEELLRSVVWGVGLGAALLARAEPGADALAPESPLLFVGSPLVGKGLTPSAKYAAVAKSPQTGFIGNSLSSSHLALAIKEGAGWDALAITGCVEAPCYVVVDHAETRFQEAATLLGSPPHGRRGAAPRRAARRLPDRDDRYRGRERCPRRRSPTTPRARWPGCRDSCEPLEGVRVRGMRPVPVVNPAELSQVAPDPAVRSRGIATAKSGCWERRATR